MKELVTVVIATKNEGKVGELRALFAQLPVHLISYSEALPDGPGVVESGTTFAANSEIKARFVCQQTKLLTLADDSGLEVDALDGRPGVRSARFAGEGATDAENNAALLAALADVDDERRNARFRCVLALANPWTDLVVLADGTCEGRIARSLRGSGGFGYDPLFVVGDSNRSMAELSMDEKNLQSHRARAATALGPRLVEQLNLLLDGTERICG